MILTNDDLVKAPRTFHSPDSPGFTSDDKVLMSLGQFIGKEVVVTEKLDGEATTMNRVRVHARSLDSKDHWTRHRVKQIYTSNVKWKLDLPQFQDIHRICGENMQGVHSIRYTEMESYFYCFGIWDRNNMRLSWDDTELLCDELGLSIVPLLAKGIFSQDERTGKYFVGEIQLDTLFTGVSKVGGEQEGWVMSLAESFHYDDYDKFVAKYVRPNHVTTDEHWTKTCTQENLIKGDKNV